MQEGKLPLVLLTLGALAILILTPNQGAPSKGPEQVPAISAVFLMGVSLLAPIFNDRLKTYEKVFDLLFLGSGVFFACHMLIFSSGLPVSHDLHHHLPGIEAVKYFVRENEFLPRWTHLFWGGVPFLRFYSPLLFVYSAVWYWLDPVQTLKILFLSFYLFSAVSIYLVALRILKDRIGSLFAGLCYTLFGYHLIDSHVRAALGELGAFIWLPPILLAYLSAFEREERSNRIRLGVISGVLLSGLFLSHLLSGFLMLSWLMGHYLYSTVLSRSKEQLVREGEVLAITVFVGMGLSAFFIVPAMLEKSYFWISMANKGFFVFTNHFVEPSHLFTRSFGWHSSPKMPLYIGNVPLFIGAVSLLLLGREKNRGKKKMLVFLLLSTVLVIVFSSTLTRGIFEIGMRQQNPIIELITLMQFPWRTLEICVLASSLLAGYTVSMLVKNKHPPPRTVSIGKAILAACLCIIVVLDSYLLTGFAGGQATPFLTNDEEGAFHWIQGQRGLFRVYLANYEYTYRMYASGFDLMTVDRGPYPEWRPLASMKIFDKAMEELREIRWLRRAGYLSVKYMVIDAVDLNDWDYYLRHDRVALVEQFGSVVVLENRLFRPYAEATVGTNDFKSPLVKSEITILEFKSETILIDIKVEQAETYYLTLKENYFTAWTASVDGRRTEVIPTENGLICVKLVGGHHAVRFDFGYTANENVGRLISGITLIAVVCILLSRRVIPRALVKLLKKSSKESSKEVQISNTEDKDNDRE